MFYINYLQENLGIKKGSLLEDPALTFQRADEKIASERGHSDLAKKMKKAFINSRKENGALDWVKEAEPRFLYWALIFMKKHKKDIHGALSRPMLIDPPDSIGRKIKTISEKELNDLSLDIKRIREEIENSFIFSEMSNTEVGDVNRLLVQEWQDIESDKRIVKWITDNEIQIEWAWDYLTSQHFFRDRLLRFLAKSDKKQALITGFDLLSDNLDKKNLLILNMKRAWSQKKFRDKKSGKKPYSISLTETAKGMLDELADRKGMRINELVETLIREEGERYGFEIKD
ncbi:MULTISPECIES: hypothetical protein [unclassified Salinivibrio]|uniref:hypothetical protein n=1 Tax=unclassified Salinivibrio TaxID=2636825 RepID=UPI00128D5C31|nr:MULTISPECIES: hypothetical protein [unclassified Salinivibrio]MPS32622.1 hypothetical protein [Salinivibrio sp. VYel7]MPX94013.1 hypothetical protein [Salinivibrio sp. VYel9]MPY00127.1 hypothetical protein [Salinivibrio sp. VYel4]MPY03195.1 hypothetical protein [Salinivibrio sp. VYel5]